MTRIAVLQMTAGIDPADNARTIRAAITEAEIIFSGPAPVAVANKYEIFITIVIEPFNGGLNFRAFG